MKTIYDIGSNNGDDIPYYLQKCDKVVAVEANPILCNDIRTRFAAAMDSGRLEVLNCVITASDEGSEVDFHVSLVHHVLSQFPPPSAEERHNFRKARLPALSIARLLERFDRPYYMKIDIEGYDAKLLRAVFDQGIFPDYISAESHTIDVFALLAGAGGYQAFKLLEGNTIANLYANAVIRDEHSGAESMYSFPEHSAGPFGNDIQGPWMSAESLCRLLAFSGLGWKDIHASRIDIADQNFQPRLSPFLNRHVTYTELLDCLATKGRSWLRRRLPWAA